MMISLSRFSVFHCALAAVLLVLALPASALAAEAGGSTEATAPGGWVQQETGTAGSGGGSSEVQQGSSLGSGGADAPAPEANSQPVESAPPPIAPEPAAPTYVEPSAAEATITESSEEPAASAEPAPTPVVEKPAPAPTAGGTAPVTGANQQAALSESLTPLVAAPAGSISGDTEGGSAFGSSAMVLMIVIALAFLAVGAWFGLGHLRQRQRFRREAAEWKAAVRRLDPKERPQLVVRKVGENGSKGRSAPSGAPPAKVH